MKFDCGPTPEELTAARKAERKRRRDARQKWHRIFVFWPKQVAPHDCRWLETIERREVQTGTKSIDVFFGAPPIFYHPPLPTYGWEYRLCL